MPPRLSLTWPFIHNNNNDDTTHRRPSSSSSSSPLRRKPRTKSRSAPGRAPRVSPRESSLYRSGGAVRAHGLSGVSDSTATQPDRDEHAHAHSYSSSLYHLQDNPSLFFPAPPPRLHLTFDTARHSVVWDDLFDWAESYDLEDDDSPLSGYCRFGYTSQVDLRATTEKRRSVRFAGSSSLGSLGLHGVGASGARSEIWTKSYLSDMSASPPVIPPRSRLRSQAPPPLTSQSSYLLPVDEPFGESTTPYTPALSACGSSDRGSPPPMPVSPETETVTFGRRKKSPAGLGKDPLRVRDGTQARRSSSGVYTPPTFPGAQGPRPSHFPSHVYTPPGFLLHPSQPATTPSTYSYTSAAGPSRSASVSSADSDTPATPASSTSRFSTLSGRAGKAMTGLKRISHQIQSNVTPPPVKQPWSARDSYFPSSINSGVQRVHEPYIPSSRPFSSSTATGYDPVSPHGLGFGLSERGGRTSGPTTPVAAGMTPETSMQSGRLIFDEASGEFTGAAKTSPQSKGRRKPVPKMLDDQLAQKVDELRLESATPTHAM